MAYCHNCGNKVSKEDSFCERCGADLKEDSKEEKPQKHYNNKRSYKGLIVFLIFLLLVGYIILDVWAANQMSPEISLESLWTSVSNLKGSAGFTSAEASTKFRMENPTFVPIFLFPMTHRLTYGSTTIAEGKTDFVFIAPYSTNDISANIEISYLSAGEAALKGIWNTISGNEEELRLDFYELGIPIITIK